jgi:hypothetical protein
MRWVVNASRKLACSSNHEPYSPSPAFTVIMIGEEEGSINVTLLRKKHSTEKKDLLYTPTPRKVVLAEI